MNERLFEKFVNAIKLLLFHSQIFGLVTFSYTETGFRLSKLRCVYSILMTFAYLSVSVYSIHEILLAAAPPVFIISALIQSSIYGISLAVIWICCLTNHSNFMELLVKMFDFDFKLQSSYILLNYDKNKKRILFHLLARYVMLTVRTALFALLTLTSQLREKLAAIAFQVAILVISAACYQIVEIVTMIQTRFKILNKQISNLEEHFDLTNASTIDSLITERKVKKQFLALSKICSLHHHLTKIIKLFNETFGVTLLLVFTVSFVAVAVPLFYITAFLQASEIRWNYVFFTIAFSMNFIIDTIYVCEVCYSTIEEAKRSGELIHRIETDDRDILAEIKMFSLQIANERAEFSAAGFFPINYTLVFSIIGGVTTYIIILIQLSATLGVELLLFHSQIFGLITFSYEEKRFRLSKLRCVYNISLTFAYLSTAVYSISKILTTAVPPVFLTTAIIQLCIYGIYLAVIWITGLTNHSSFIEFLLKMIDFDTKLLSSSIIINYHKNRKKMLCQLLGRYVMLAFLVALCVHFILTNPQLHEEVTTCVCQVAIFMNSAVCYQIIGMVSMINTRFAILNKQISKLIDYFLKTDISTNATLETGVEKRFRKQFLALCEICSLHHHLTKMIKLFNDTFGVTLLMMFGASFVSISISLFYATALLQGSEIEWIYVLSTTAYCMSFIFDTIYVCEVCYATIVEANKSGELIHKIETEDTDILDEIEMFSLQILNEQTEFSAAGFFPINYTLVFSMIGGITTYIVILLQLAATLID
ncbi:7tm 7 domain containing protein [Asbolus verrucosus]|uniref:7tm 7 domain containing protein n=1 Tax=Asbolus verrucosus TaxID=1661398 RepID=A0A482W3I3_ASBVE|nr:7tm 7 domain containing protein [Asbolus verrucosus]